MDLFMIFLKDTWYQNAYLWTTNELGTAASIYTRNGFKLTEEKPSDIFGKSLIEHRFNLEL